jgi:uncharacterized membrane protein
VTGGSSVAANGNLRQLPGKITAGVTWGTDVIAFKNKGVFRGSYRAVGDTIWDWSLIPGGEKLGAWGPGCVVQTSNKVYFVGDQGFWSFDGTNFQPEDAGMWDTLNSFLASGVAGAHVYTKLAYDSVTNLVTIHNRGTDTGAGNRTSDCEEFYSFHVVSGAWGHQSRLTGRKRFKNVAGQGQRQKQSGNQREQRKVGKTRRHHRGFVVFPLAARFAKQRPDRRKKYHRGKITLGNETNPPAGSGA